MWFSQFTQPYSPLILQSQTCHCESALRGLVFFIVLVLMLHQLDGINAVPPNHAIDLSSIYSAHMPHPVLEDVLDYSLSLLHSHGSRHRTGYLWRLLFHLVRLSHDWTWSPACICKGQFTTNCVEVSCDNTHSISKDTSQQISHRFD